jgi:hypothetical protein
VGGAAASAGPHGCTLRRQVPPLPLSAVTLTPLPTYTPHAPLSLWVLAPDGASFSRFRGGLSAQNGELTLTGDLRIQNGRHDFVSRHTNTPHASASWSWDNRRSIRSAVFLLRKWQGCLRVTALLTTLVPPASGALFVLFAG